MIALSVVWSLCRHGKGKGIIVCPSTLVANWKLEIQRFFPGTLGRTALFILSSKKNGADVLEIMHESIFFMVILDMIFRERMLLLVIL